MTAPETIHVFRSISKLTGTFYGRSGRNEVVRLEKITAKELEGQKGVYTLRDFRGDTLTGLLDKELEQLEDIEMDGMICVEGNYFECFDSDYFMIKNIEKYH